MSWNTVHENGQWLVQVSEDGSQYRLINPGTEGNLRFYQVISGQYGEPIVDPEPEYKIPVPDGCDYVDGAGDFIVPEQCITGIIIKEGKTVVARLSLTNARSKGMVIELSDCGLIEYQGHAYYLKTLLIKDKNRIRGYDAFFSPTKPELVEVLELQDLF